MDNDKNNSSGTVIIKEDVAPDSTSFKPVEAIPHDSVQKAVKTVRFSKVIVFIVIGLIIFGGGKLLFPPNSDAEYVSQAITLFKEKYNGTVTVSNSRLVEKDAQGRGLITFDITGKNAFGGEVTNYVAVIIQYRGDQFYSSNLFPYISAKTKADRDSNIKVYKDTCGWGK